MKNIKKVVGVAFIQNNKLLIVQSVRSSKTNSWTFVGGGVEDNETIVEAAIREVSEEIHSGFTIEESDLVPVLCFTENAASDPSLMIEMNVFICTKKVDVELIPNQEIMRYHWYDIHEEGYNVSSSIKDHFVPYAINKGLLK